MRDRDGLKAVPYDLNLKAVPYDLNLKAVPYDLNLKAVLYDLNGVVARSIIDTMVDVTST